MLHLFKSLIRRTLYAIRFAGRNIHVHPTAWISSRALLKTTAGGSITIGPDCAIHDSVMLLTYGGDIQIGAHCSINPFTVVYGTGGIVIGEGVRIAAHTVIVPSNHNRSSDARPLRLAGYSAKGIVIGDHVWVGTGCRILDGVTIGRHAILGAGAVIRNSVPDNTLAVGVPARLIPQSS